MYILSRTYEDKQTLGELYNPKGEELCKTLELAWLNNAFQVSCIPEGEYDVVERYSEKYKKHWHITNVKDRSYILIHHGNYAGSLSPKSGKSDILGCVLVGSAHIDINNDGIKDIINSVNTINVLRKILPNKFKLKIIKK